MNVFKRLFSRKNRKSGSKDNCSSPKPESSKVPAIVDSNNINSNILDQIYIEDVSVLRIDNKPLAKHDELPLNANPTDGKSGDSSAAHETIEVDSTSSAGTEGTVAVKETFNTTDITSTSTDIITSDISDDDSLDSDIQILPTITRGMCNINSVSGIEEVLNQIIKELNKIIIERERLRRKLKLKGNSYKIVARKFSTLLNNRAYKPIKMA
ncbi:hypothetical protein MACJ_000519 [Theileria orientalis]|uniref:Uncharacterized protein n=1 Tax=Theileria orientalis TaxID=68886 RepID=A0A976M6H1_THEOR|nr:hypothetical protein MACJ_000519 [Theileria orientalis]